MKLDELIKGVNAIKIKGSTDLDIKNVKIDSNSVNDGTLFICINGRGFDGHDFISQVVNYGAIAIICEKEVDTSVTQVIVDNSRKAMSIIAGNFYSHPDKALKIIGVTGTNGKTTTTHILKKIFDVSKIKCGVIGTLGIYYCDKYLEPSLTTPDPLELFKILFDMKESGIKVVVMEVSAHALYLEKIEGLFFEVAVFTNFTQDHLDFFGTMEEYKNAKLKFFENNRCKFIVSNSDDELGLYIIQNYKNVISYGIDNPADNFAIKIAERQDGTKFVINLFDCIYDVNLSLIGKFNVYNSLAAATSSSLLGVKTDDVILGLESVKEVSGRLELVYNNDFAVYIDYAHTPDGLKKALLSLRTLSSGRIINVFGCGGNRDNGKRKIMGEISGKLADFTVITTDNPRFEEPMDIIRQIEEGVLSVSKKYVIVQDRAEGIKYALDYARKGDTVLIAGKGAEKYQDVLGVKHLYNDKETITEILGD